MKKIASIFLVSAGILTGCHPATSPSVISPPASSQKDSVKAQTLQQSVDTSIKKDGQVIKRYPNGVIRESSNYVAGRRHGECQSFYPTGKLWTDDYFTNGVLDGPTTNYFDNGQKRYEGNYKNGKPAGIWKIYDTQGKLVRTIDYDKKENNQSM